MPTIRAALVQMRVEDGALEKNTDRGFAMLGEVAGRGADIVVLPELWTSGYRLDELSTQSAHNHALLPRLMNYARENGCLLVAGSMALGGANTFQNHSIVFSPRGKVLCEYSKWHLFPGLQEEYYFGPGKQLTTFETPWGRGAVAICFDIRFPELIRQHYYRGLDFLFVPAEWPQPRLEHWKALLRARAIENLCFVLACNIAGRPEEDRLFGGTCVFDPWGRELGCLEQQEQVLYVELNTEALAEAREKLPVAKFLRPELKAEDVRMKPAELF